MAEIKIKRTNDAVEVKNVVRLLSSENIDSVDYSEDILWVVKRGSKSIGMCSLKPLPAEDSVFFSFSFIDPEHRGKGLQRKLIRARLEWARRHGYACALTYTWENNYPSMSNLIKCGFRFYTPHTKYAGKAFYFKKDI